MDEMSEQLKKDLHQLGDLSSQALTFSESVNTALEGLLALCKVPAITTVLPPVSMLTPKKN